MGRSAGEKGLEAFDAFVAERERLCDWSSYVNPGRTRLRRAKIAEACGFGRSALLQNKAVVRRLWEVECDLRARSILAGSRVKSNEDDSHLSESRDERINRLDQDLSRLEATIEEYFWFIRGVQSRAEEIVSEC